MTWVIAYCIGAVLVLGLVGYALHKAFPRREPVSKHRVPKDIKTWDGYGQRRHALDETNQFSAIDPGQNKHYADETSEMRVIPPVPGRVLEEEPWQRDLQRYRRAPRDS